MLLRLASYRLSLSFCFSFLLQERCHVELARHFQRDRVTHPNLRHSFRTQGVSRERRRYIYRLYIELYMCINTRRIIRGAYRKEWRGEECLLEPEARFTLFSAAASILAFLSCERSTWAAFLEFGWKTFSFFPLPAAMMKWNCKTCLLKYLL